MERSPRTLDDASLVVAHLDVLRRQRLVRAGLVEALRRSFGHLGPRLPRARGRARGTRPERILGRDPVGGPTGDRQRGWMLSDLPARQGLWGCMRAVVLGVTRASRVCVPGRRQEALGGRPA